MRSFKLPLAVATWVVLVAAGLLFAQQGPASITAFVGSSGAARGPLLATAGSLSNPSYSFAGDPDTGFASELANVISVVSGGARTMLLQGGGTLNLRGDSGCLLMGTSDDLKYCRGAAGLHNFTDADGTPDLNFNTSGAPTPSSCGDGAVQTGSSNTSGRVVGTTQTACTLTFSTSFGGNSADCWIENLTANRGNVTAASSTAFTVSNLTAGDDFMYFCAGR